MRVYIVSGLTVLHEIGDGELCNELQSVEMKQIYRMFEKRAYDARMNKNNFDTSILLSY